MGLGYSRLPIQKPNIPKRNKKELDIRIDIRKEVEDENGHKYIKQTTKFV